MTSFARWLLAIAVDNVFRGVAAAWALSTLNCGGGGRLVLAPGAGVNVVVICNPFVAAPNIAASDLQSE